MVFALFLLKDFFQTHTKKFNPIQILLFDQLCLICKQKSYHITMLCLRGVLCYLIEFIRCREKRKPFNLQVKLPFSDIIK